jgi:hypothetical protein
MQQPSRIEQARSRLATTRLIVGAGSVVAFAALALVARAAHPGTHKAAVTTAAATTGVTFDDSRHSRHSRRDQSDSFFGQGSISSSSSSSNTSPQATSSGS